MNFLNMWRRFVAKQKSLHRSRTLRKIERLSRKASPLGDIKQFFYLDVLALRSLYISRFGPEDAKTTLSTTRTSDFELLREYGTNSPGSEGGSLNTSSTAKFRSGRSRSIQIEQVSSEQSLFRDFISRELYAGKNSQLWDGVPQSDVKPQDPSTSLRRGQLIQIRVRLEADTIYAISTIASAFAETASSAPDAGITQTESMVQTAQLIQHMLIGQVPINAELVDWRWDNENKKLTMEHNLSSSKPIRLVGLTQLDNYWGDVRGLLFDQAECTALVRVSENVPSSYWSPLKLFNAARGLPGFSALEEKIASLGSILNGKEVISSPTSDLTPDILLHYFERRAESTEIIQRLKPIAISIAQSCPSDSPTQLEQAFNQIDQLLSLSQEVEIDRDCIGKMRSEAIAFERKETVTAEEIATTPPSSREKNLYLVGEIIGFYW